MSLALSIVRIWRGGAARRRYEAVPHDTMLRVPVRLRGADPRYPGLFRMGWFHAATGRWRPRWRWGASVSLAGTQAGLTSSAMGEDAVPLLLRNGTVLDCRDRHGSRFKLLVDDDDLPAVRRGLAVAPSTEPELGPIGRWRRLQIALPPSAVLCLLAGFGWLALLAPRTGALGVAWMLACPAAYWAGGAVLVANQVWHRRRLARADLTPVHRFDPVTGTTTSAQERWTP